MGHSGLLPDQFCKRYQRHCSRANAMAHTVVAMAHHNREFVFRSRRRIILLPRVARSGTGIEFRLGYFL